MTLASLPTPMSARRLLLLSSLSLLTSTFASAQVSDLPGGNGDAPRALIIFDNSRSMLALPQNATDMSCAPTDDYYPGISSPEYPVNVATSCGLGPPYDLSRCRNKL